jgi:hypothetical protein
VISAVMEIMASDTPLTPTCQRTPSDSIQAMLSPN